MKNKNKDQIMQALAALLPEDAQKEVFAAVEGFVGNARAELQAEYDAKLEEAYGIVAEEKQKIEEEGYKGYAEAYQIICDLRDRLEVQREEFEHTLEANYEEAYQMLVEQRAQKESLEVDMYEDYDRKVKEVREFYVEKLEQFLSQKGEEFYEQAKRDVLSDPTMAEHKVALEKILEVASNFMSEEDYHFATSAKLDTLTQQVEELRGQCKIVEAKNFRLSTENNRLTEAVRQNQEVLTENVRGEQKERVKKSKNAEGRGKREPDRVEVIAEHKVPHAPESGEEYDDETRFVETYSPDITDQWSKLAGITKRD
jgi:predicted Holliday junction resolvase-like endonuclease